MPTGCGQQSEPTTITETRNISCNEAINDGNHYSGMVEQERTVTTPSRGSASYGDWMGGDTSSCEIVPMTTWYQIRYNICYEGSTNLSPYYLLMVIKYRK